MKQCYTMVNPTHRGISANPMTEDILDESEAAIGKQRNCRKAFSNSTCQERHLATVVRSSSTLLSREPNSCKTQVVRCICRGVPAGEAAGALSSRRGGRCPLEFSFSACRGVDTGSNLQKLKVPEISSGPRQENVLGCIEAKFYN